MTSKNATAPQMQEYVGDVPNDRPGDGTTGGEIKLPTADKIIVTTQKAGKFITIDNISLTKPGYVVIHETGASGAIGPVIGATKWLSAGDKEDLTVSATTVSGKKYAAMLHYDDGDKKFDAAKDPMAAGTKSTAIFLAQ